MQIEILFHTLEIGSFCSAFHLARSGLFFSCIFLAFLSIPSLFISIHKVWDLMTGICMQTLQAHSNVVMGLLFWNQYLISGSLDGTVKVRNRTTFIVHEKCFFYCWYS